VRERLNSQQTIFLITSLLLQYKVEFSPELLAFAVRREDSTRHRLRALADRRTCARVARLYRTLSLVHGALVNKSAIRKRSLFYADVALFRAQAASDAALLDCAALLQVPPARLGVHASPRGLVRGSLLLNGSDCRKIAHLIPAAGESIDIQIGDDVRFILIIEKEVSFRVCAFVCFGSVAD
jgi:DNA topoisomerase VI subunit A